MVKNSNFILIGLIIVAISCIYLLYLNLGKANDLNNIKYSVRNLIDQNKKRDEIMNHILTNLNKLKEKDDLREQSNNIKESNNITEDNIESEKFNNLNNEINEQYNVHIEDTEFNVLQRQSGYDENGEIINNDMDSFLTKEDRDFIMDNQFGNNNDELPQDELPQGELHELNQQMNQLEENIEMNELNNFSNINNELNELNNNSEFGDIKFNINNEEIQMNQVLDINDNNVNNSNLELNEILNINSNTVNVSSNNQLNESEENIVSSIIDETIENTLQNTSENTIEKTENTISNENTEVNTTDNIDETILNYESVDNNIEIDLSKIPKSKKKLLDLTVKELKQITTTLKISSNGNKNKLADRILTSMKNK